MYKNNSSGAEIEGFKKCYVFKIMLNNYIPFKIYNLKLFAVLFTTLQVYYIAMQIFNKNNRTRKNE